MKNLFIALTGTWFICATNFPMWLKGNKNNPTFNYSIVRKNGKEILVDEVKYLKNNKEKIIVGFDYPDKKDSTAFVWRGKGLLGLVKSHWKVILMDESRQWAVIWFSKTLFTSEGVDIISHTPTISTDKWRKIKLKMEKNPLLKKHISSLQML